MIIYGAGMAGLIAANMLRRYKPTIHEAAPSLPHNHEALLRFRSDAVSRATGIPFKRVVVQKAIYHERKIITTPNLQLSNMYAEKVTGKMASRSILNLEPAERFIAPPHFIGALAMGCDIQFGAKLDETTLSLSRDNKHFTGISTIPMPALMKLANWPSLPSFDSRPINVVTTTITNPETDLYQTIYYPSPEFKVYRASITGNKLIIEMLGSAPDLNDAHNTVFSVVEDFGFAGQVLWSEPTISTQKYGKITPIDPSVRKEFILAMTDRHNLYSLGRFATWRQILLDDIINDIHTIDEFITQRDSYQRHLHSISK